MKKIIVIGGNQGGLAMAIKLGSLGHEVKLFEKKKREDVAYDWHDFVNPTIFERLNLPLIDKEYYKEKENWIFVSPGERVKLPVPAGNSVRDIGVMRRPLNDYLFELAEKCANLKYSCEVEGLIIKDGGVCGVRVGGEEIYADLTVDCSGVYSPFRKSLPAEFKIQAMPHEKDVMISYRGFYERRSDIPESEIINKLYFQHNNEKGLSWFAKGDEPNNVDVLVSRIGKIDESTVQGAIEKLKADNPALGDRLLRGGVKTAIPLRYPISRMVAKGYVLAGNSAFMTVPLMGSGIAMSMLCAQLLSEVLSKDESCELDNLWKYQVCFYEECGAKNTGIDVLKRWMLKIDSKDLDFFFESGILNKEMLAAGGGGNKPKITPKIVLATLYKGAKHPVLLAKIVTDLIKMNKATELAYRIPREFDEKAVCTWQEKLDGMFKSYD